MSHDLGALVVEDEEMLVGFDEIGALTGEEPGDVEPGLADLDDAIGCDGGVVDPVPANRSLLVFVASVKKWIADNCRASRCLTMAASSPVTMPGCENAPPVDSGGALIVMATW